MRILRIHPLHQASGWLLFLLMACLMTFGHRAEGVEVTIGCGGGGADKAMCFQYAQQWALKTGNTVKNFSPPGSFNEKLALYRQLFAAHSSDLDVLPIDVTFPAVLKDHLLDLKPYTKGLENEHFANMIAINTLNDRLIALPWFSDAGVLYYRADLLKKYGRRVPQTWDELTATATAIQAAERQAGRADFHGFVFQGKASEGLACNALEWIYSNGGGALMDAQGNITINNPHAAEALNRAAQWVGTITPSGVLNYEEEDTRGVFQTGHALFMRNWPYAWSLAQKPDSPVRGLVGIAKLPGSAQGPGVGTLGGWSLAVSRYSHHPAEAADLALYMTSAAVQKQRAIEGSLNPSRPALFQDPEVMSAIGDAAILADVLKTAVVRPTNITGFKFPQVSQNFYNAASDVLAQRTSGEEAVKKLATRFKRIKRESW